MNELVIFDCDGVLVDSERIAIKVDAKVLARLGWSLTEAEIVERFVGASEQDFRSAIEFQLGRLLPDDWEVEFEPMYRAAMIMDLVQVNGIEEALDQINLL